MSLIDDLQAGSFKGVKFLMTSATMNGGRKDVVHSFPNSDRQNIEDLGLAPPIIQIEMVISGENYLYDRDLLIQTVTKGGPGVLIHPLYGRIENMVARTFSLNETLTELGYGRLTVTFEVSDTFGLPERTKNTVSVIEADNTALIAILNQDIVDNYNVDTGLQNSFTDAVSKVSDMVDTLRDQTSFIQAAADQINDFSKQLSDLESNITSLVQAPQSLSDSVSGLFATIDNLYPTVEATVSVLAGFFDFGDDDTQRSLTTKSRIERDKNDKIMNSVMQTMALGYSYLNTAQIDFETVAEIEESAAALDEQYKKIIAADGLSQEAKDQLTDMRNNMQQFFDEQKITARQLVTIESNLTSARLLAYQYYGDSTEGEQMANINDVSDVAFIEGSLQVLTA